MTKDNSTKIVFFGTPKFAVPTLQALVTEGYHVVLVITQPDEPVGRKQVLTPTPIKVEALKLNVPVKENLWEIKNYNADLGVVVAYGKIIPQAILDLFPLGLLNIHPSLLPKYRGPSPIQSAILNGDDETGVSIIKLDEQMDHGPIISQIQVPISKDESSPTLFDKLSVLGAELMIKALPDYVAGKAKLEPQDDSKATYCEMINKEDGLIDWTNSADQIERQIRAYAPWPGSFSEFDVNHKKINIKIISAIICDPVETRNCASLPHDNQSPVGKFVIKNNQLVVQCGHGALLIEKLQPEGKKEMPAQAFINGYLK
ncbi:MAG: methionyl-tRNA formyltransferase [Candidatus Komeilibacteria bacterium]|nr:methionyl-tRNA formyltransferase [Candidatus Komeilibacteria bacterium]